MPLVENLRRFATGTPDTKATPYPSVAGAPGIYDSPGYKRFTQREAKRHLESYGGDQAIDHVMNCVRYIADTASTADYHFEQEGKKVWAERTEDTPKGARLVDPALRELLKYPNPWMTYSEMIELITIDLLVVGNSYWVKFRPNGAGQPVALYRMCPPYVAIEGSKTTLIDHYEYQMPGAKKLEFAPEEVIHFRLPNPHSEGNVLGLGIIQGGARMYDVELGLVETQAQFFEQGAKLSGVVETDRSVPEPILQKIQRQFRSVYSGARNAYRVAVLERGLKFSPIQPTAAESQFEVLSKLSRERVHGMFRLPRVLLNPEGNEHIQEAQKAFDTKTMRPYLNKLQEALSAHLTRAWAVDFRIDYEYVLPDDERIAIAQQFSTLPGVTVREVRLRSGLGPLGDERDEIVLNLPMPSTESPLGSPDQPLAGEPGPKPPGNATTAFPEKVNDRPASAADKRRREANGRGIKAMDTWATATYGGLYEADDGEA